MPERDMTAKEKAWVATLKRTIKAMPLTMELIVRHNSIDVCESGARQEYFDAKGDTDNVPDLLNISTLKMRIWPGGESL